MALQFGGEAFFWSPGRCVAEDRCGRCVV